MRFSFRAQLWMHDGPGAWHFVTLPVEVARDIRAVVEPAPRGFGSIRVAATIGRTRWNTSIFPDAKSGSYVLPVKKPVRQAERIAAGDEVDASIEVDV